MQLYRKEWSRVGVLAVGLLALAACDDDGVGPDGGGQIPPGTAVVEGSITGNRTFVAETTYVLKGFVKVESGAQLTIEPGTKIVGDTTTAGSSLFVLRGGRLVAEGTAAEPIVFTSQRAPGNRKPGDWGGIVIVGNATVNRSADPIQTEGPATGTHNYAGGTNDDDDSGSLRYVRIEFAGYDVSGGSGQELNGLSMYAVGRGTKLQYVQSHAGLDDGFEWFGGTVDGQYLVSSEVGDDHFDWSEGYRGRNQFLLAFQSGRLIPATGTGSLGSDPRGFEGDGCEEGRPGCNGLFRLNQPLSRPTFANFTLIGAQTTGYPTGGNAAGMVVRRGTGGNLYNGIVARFNGFGVSVRDTVTLNNLTSTADLVVRNVAFVDNGATFAPAGSTELGQVPVFAGSSLLAPAGEAETFFGSLASGTPNLVPTAAAAAFVNEEAQVPASLFANYSYGFETTSYIGAFAPGGTNWAAGWTNFRVD